MFYIRGDEMTIMTEDGEMIVGVGGSNMLYSMYSTVKCQIRFSTFKLGLALKFLQTGECSRSKVSETLRQLMIVKEELSGLQPNKVVYNCDDMSEKAPWSGNISMDISSCVDLFTTDDGRVLIDELIHLFEYADTNNLSVVLP